MNNKTLVLLLLAACGDGGATPDGSVQVDGPLIDAAVTPPRAIVVAGDFMPGHPGVLSSLDVETRVVMSNVGPSASVGFDPVLRHIGDELLIVNRAEGNNVTILDATTLQFKEQLGTGAGSNPQDVAVVGTKLYVATFSGKGLLELTRGSTTITEIDLSADDPDGTPNCESVVVAGGDLYVACGLLDNTFAPRGPGKVYVVDPATHAIKKTVTMMTRNPLGLIEVIPPAAPHAGDLVIPTVFFDDGSGCVERITAAGASAASAGCVVTNAQLGGNVNRVAFYAPELTGPVTGIVPSSIMYLSVSVGFPKADLRAFDLTSNTLTPERLNPTTQAISDVAVCEATGHLVVTDTTMGAAGLRVYQGIHETTTAALPFGLQPSSSHGIVCY